MNKKEIRDLVFTKYGTLMLSRQQAAEILNISVATIDRWKQDGLHLEYKKIGKARNSMILYPIDTVAEFIAENNTKKI